MGIAPGAQLGTYEIVAAIGEGGMGEVYRARDSKLGRDVAVKTLPDIFALDPERLARFDREAQVLAALNHPNLGIIHELKEINGAKYLILELVEGETVADRIGRGPIPIDQSIDIALQIARGVQAAHDKGIVHRDLKPANVKITPEGLVKVLDFGLAKIQESAATDQNISYSPTLSGGAQGTGAVLGTAAYMSPEQARGKELDRRADVWAFGCILFEMLSGRQLFPTGETVSDTLAGILVREPDLKALPAATPPKVRALVERCLRKDERRRLRDIGDARVALEEARSESEASAAAAGVPVESRRRELAFGILATFFLLAGIGLAARLFFMPGPVIHPVRMDLGVPVGVPNGFYLSPDGRKVAFVSVPQAGARIWVRSLDSAAAEPIPSTEGIAPTTQFGPNNNAGQNNNLFWSADSRNIAFVAEGKLKKVAATGGPAQELATLPGGNYFGTWNDDNVILVAADGPAGPLLRVPAGGGQPTPETELDKTRKEQSHRYPHFLPDGRHYLYLSTGADARDRVVYVGTLGSKDRHPLPGIAAEVKYSSGHLVFVRDGSLMAQKFDLERLETVGDAFTIADRFAPPGALTWTFSASVNGLLAYRSSLTAQAAPNAELVWYDRKGARLTVAAPEGEYQGPELSRDGKFVAFTRGSDIWWLDIEKNRQTALTTEAGDDLNPRWSPDGAIIAFDSTRDSGSGIYQRAVGVVGADKLVYKPEGAKSLRLSDWSRDGKYLAYVQDGDVWVLPRAGDLKNGDRQPGAAKPIQVTKTPHTESLPRISPDSRWIAYVSNKTNATEVYIQSFPEPGVEQQVSSGAGAPAGNALAQPRWNRDGTELFYFYGFAGVTPRFMSVSIKPSGGSLNAAAAVPAFGHPAARAPFSSVFSVATDDRFLLQLAPNVAAATPGGPPVNSTPGATSGITLILDWASGDREP
jgi:Tol biopolymer transport system component